ncbi:hypothetical protein RND81_13G094100 [Saponaria officinalis]|uniref:Uncharacterized protein n=1 Tax=Saponaria officinalis TaxID=3572 RepID=A0AAW1GZC6_SAPOF
MIWASSMYYNARGKPVKVSLQILARQIHQHDVICSRESVRSEHSGYSRNDSKQDSRSERTTGSSRHEYMMVKAVRNMDNTTNILSYDQVIHQKLQKTLDEV